MKPCKHLDHNPENYPSCEFVTLTDFSCLVSFFQRTDYLPGGPLHYDGAPVKVQFCGKGKGRINGIFQCYNPGEMSCYEPEQDQPAADELQKVVSR